MKTNVKIHSNAGQMTKWQLMIAAVMLAALPMNAQTESCPDPDEVRVTEVGPTSARLTWNSTGATGYYVEMWHGGVMTDTSITETTLVMAGLEGQSTYSVYVHGMCSDGSHDTHGTYASFVTSCYDTVPWGIGISDGQCWTAEDFTWDVNLNYAYISNHDSTQSRLLSPWFEVPEWAATDPVGLVWKGYAIKNAEVIILATIDEVYYDTLFHDLVYPADNNFGGIYGGPTFTHITPLDSTYAGKTARLVFVHQSSSTLFNRTTTQSGTLRLNLLDFELRTVMRPVPVVDNWPTKGYTHEPILFAASLQEGTTEGLTYSWYSELMDTTLAGDSVWLTYTIGGTDHVRLTVSNRYGTYVDSTSYSTTIYDCPAITAMPWIKDLGENSECWRVVEGSTWTTATASGNPAFCGASGQAGVIVSPQITLPSDTTGGLRFEWQALRSGYSNTTYYVMATTGAVDDLAAYDTLGTFSASSSSLTTKNVDLSAYAGQTIRVAFRRNSSGANMYVAKPMILSGAMPLATLESTAKGVASVGDTVRYRVRMQQGSDSGLVFNWQSTMGTAGYATMMAADSVLTVVYTAEGVDTLHVEVSNVYGSIELNTTTNAFICNTISTFPWEEDFMEFGNTNAYNACWQISGWSHCAQGHGYGLRDENGVYLQQRYDYMISNVSNNYIITPAIAVPSTGAEHLSLWVTSAQANNNSLCVAISTTGADSLALFTDTVITGLNQNRIFTTRTVPLAPYAGQTIHAAIMRRSSSINYLDRVAVDYDTLPKVWVAGPSKAITNFATQCIAWITRGMNEPTTYTWHSIQGDIISTNATGDTMTIVYRAGLTSDTDTITVVATNAFGSDTATTTIHLQDCTPALTLPWRETFADGIYCWHRPGVSQWVDWVPYYYPESARCLTLDTSTDTAGSWIVSKPIHLPADSALRPTLFWKVASNNNTRHQSYQVLISDSTDYTDTANYTLLLHDTAAHRNFSGYDTMHVSLAPYAGRAVRIAFHNTATHLLGAGLTLFIDDVEIRPTALPRVALTADKQEVWYADTVHLAATLAEGSDSLLAYTWHSSLLDTTFVGGPTCELCYGLTSGTDTVSVVATNAFGTDSTSVVVRSTILTQPALQLAIEGKSPYNGEDRAEVGDTVVYVVSRNRCVTTGMCYTLHSTLMDTTFSLLTTADTVRFALPYTIEGRDTVLVTLSNTYGNNSATTWMNVNDCPVASVPFYENFDNLGTSGYPDCWPGYWLLTSHDVDNYGVSYTGSTVAHTALISPAIDLPADSTGLLLSWYTHFNGSGYNVPVRILLSPTGSSHIAHFTDTAYFRYMSNNTRDSVSLDRWRGQRVRVAFYIDGYSAILDDIRIDYDRSAPWFTINGPTNAEMPTDNVYAAHLYGGSPHDLTYSWRSSMADGGLATVNTHADTAIVRYFATGTDTLRCIATNRYGADTVVRMVSVSGCDYQPTPFAEDFNSTAGGTLPDCWKAQNDASVQTTAISFFHSPDATNMLVLRAPMNNYYNNPEATAMLPVFNDAVSTLTLTFWYAYEDTAYGHLSVGYMDGGEFTPVAEMPKVDAAGRYDTLRFATAPASASRLAFHWEQSASSTWYSCSIDNVEVTSSAPPHNSITLVAADTTLTTVLLEGTSATYIGDTCRFQAIVASGDTTGLHYSWRSALTGTTLASASHFDLAYTTTGIDTIMLTVSNGVDTGTIRHRVAVTAPLQVAISAPARTTSGDPFTAHALVTEGSTYGVTYTWHSTMADAGLALATVMGDCLAIEYIASGTDTLTLTATNGFNSHSTQFTVEVLQCNVADFPFSDSFESGGFAPEGTDCVYEYCKTIDDCWLTVNTAPDGQGWARSEDYSRSGYWAMEATYSTHGDPTSDWLISPTIEVPDSGTVVMRFRLLYLTYSIYPAIDHLHCLVSTNGRADTALFTTELSVQDLGQDGTFWRAYAVHLDAFRGQTIHIALRNDATAHYDNSTDNSGKRVLIDDIDFYFDQTPVATLHTNDTYYSCDPAVATVGYNRFDEVAYSVRWHSAMASRGLATLQPQGDTLHINYLASGLDTIAVAVENAFGIDSVSHTAQVYHCPVVDNFPHVSTPVTDDNEWHCWKVWNRTLYSGWARGTDSYYHDHYGSYPCIISKLYSGEQTDGHWLVSPLISLPADADTITLRWNGLCEHTTFNLELSTTGRDSTAQFSTTLFTETVGSLYTPRWQYKWRTYTVDLTPYRGQTVSLAWHNAGPTQSYYGTVAMDTMWIECGYASVGVNLTEEPSGTFAIYPNPTSHAVTISTSEPGQAVVFNATGIEVKRITLAQGENTINVTDLAPGIYFIRLRSAYQKLQVVR